MKLIFIIRVKNATCYGDPALLQRMEYDLYSDESVSKAVVRAVSAVEGREPRSLEPLTHVIDTDALDALFASRPNGKPRTGGCLSFIYGSSRVIIDNGECLSIEPLERFQQDPRPL